jgi:putative hydrolase of the HAD superfamily
MNKYRFIFFDLDRTLWDFDANSRETIFELIGKYGLRNQIKDEDHMHAVFNRHNEKLWSDYRKGSITKSFLRTERFRLTFRSFGIYNQELAKKIAADYILLSPSKTTLVPDAIEVLDYLYPKYKLFIITNGFNEVQYTKLANSNISGYFARVITAENAGINKPNSKIFAHALRLAKADKAHSLMIGDDLETDIKGARDFGMDQVYYNPSGSVHNDKISYEITSLSELKTIL